VTTLAAAFNELDAKIEAGMKAYEYPASQPLAGPVAKNM